MNPDIQTPPEFQFYVQQHGLTGKREFERNSIPGLGKSLNKAHDNLQKQVRINTLFDEKLLDAQSRLRFARGWIWVLTLTIAGSWALIFGMVKLWLEPILERVPR